MVMGALQLFVVAGFADMREHLVRKPCQRLAGMLLEIERQRKQET